MEMRSRMFSTKKKRIWRTEKERRKTRWKRLIAILQRIWRRISSKLLLVVSLRSSAISQSRKYRDRNWNHAQVKLNLVLVEELFFSVPVLTRDSQFRHIFKRRRCGRCASRNFLNRCLGYAWLKGLDLPWKGSLFKITSTNSSPFQKGNAPDSCLVAPCSHH